MDQNPPRARWTICNGNIWRYIGANRVRPIDWPLLILLQKMKRERGASAGQDGQGAGQAAHDDVIRFVYILSGPWTCRCQVHQGSPVPLLSLYTSPLPSPFPFIIFPFFLPSSFPSLSIFLSKSFLFLRMRARHKFQQGMVIYIFLYIYILKDIYIQCQN